MAEELLKDKCIAIDQTFSNDEINKLEGAIWKMGGKIIDNREGAIVDYFVVEKLTKNIESCVAVTPSWIYMLQKHFAWVEPRSFSPLTTKIMSGFRVWVLNNVAKSDRAIIYACVEHLGGYSCFEKETNLTHCVADEYDPIIDVLLKHGVKVVVPEYFGDCFRLGMVCPPKQYSFPDVPVRNCNLKELLSGATPRYQKPELVTPDPSLFAGKIFFVDTLLYNSNNPKPLWLDNIETLGGKLVRKLELAKTVITETRGQLFEKALELNLEVGTKRWIRDQIKSNKLTSPLAAVLHYPYPLGEIEGMNSCVISVTNYIGDPREDIASMAKRMGAKFTRNLTKDNTHIICGDCKGEKFAKAKDWNLHTVNHLWLEETYSKWQYQREGKERYLSFPGCLNEMVNKTQVYDHNLIAPLVPQNRKLEKSVNGKMANAVEHESSHLKFKNGKAIDDAIQNAAMQSDTVISYKATLKEELVINEEVNSRKRKRSSQDSATAVSIIDLKGSSIAITGIRLTPQEEAKFNSLGIEVTDEITSASVLIAERVSRTEKFLMAISLSVPIVSSAWKDKLVSGSQIPSVENFILADPEGEKTYDFSMKNSVKTSKMINILKGFTIYCTPSVQPPIETITRLVEANAGYFGEIITRRNVQRIKEDIASFDGNTVCLSTASDFALIEKLGQKCYSTEWLLNSILRQDTSFLKNFQLKP